MVITRILRRASELNFRGNKPMGWARRRRRRRFSQVVWRKRITNLHKVQMMLETKQLHFVLSSVLRMWCLGNAGLRSVERGMAYVYGMLVTRRTARGGLLLSSNHEPWT
jgi:hypothetical protein